MSFTAQRNLALLLPASGFALCFAMAARADMVQSLPVDRPVQTMGVQAACTGIGDREENEARWKSYPLKLEVVGGRGEWLANEEVTLRSRDGAHVMRVRCDAPWVLMDVRPGRYDATVRLPDAPAEQIKFTVPREGQRDVVVRFSSLMDRNEVHQKSSS